MLFSLVCITDAELTVRPDRGAGGGRSDRGGSDRGGSERRPDRRDDRDRDYRSRCVTGAPRHMAVKQGRVLGGCNSGCTGCLGTCTSGCLSQPTCSSMPDCQVGVCPAGSPAIS